MKIFKTQKTSNRMPGDLRQTPLCSSLCSLLSYDLILFSLLCWKKIPVLEIAGREALSLGQRPGFGSIVPVVGAQMPADQLPPLFAHPDRAPPCALLTLSARETPGKEQNCLYSGAPDAIIW